MSTPPEKPPGGLPPPRFTLSTLLWSVTLFCGFCAILVYAGSHLTLLLVLFALAIFAHVAGNAIGTKLRDVGDQSPREPRTHSRPLRQTDYAPPTQLRQKRSLGWTTVIVTITGAAACAGVAAVGFSLLAGAKVATIGIGCLAAGVLGGIWSFLAVSFVQVAFGAASQAAKDEPR